jgi:predicted Fe-Mo cluster-binding NifX family protein
MRIAISADDNKGLESIVSPHFGRCPHYILVDLDGHEVQGVGTVDNPYFGQHAPGQVPGLIHSQGVNVMLTGGMGQRAIGFFRQFGIEPVTGASGTVRQALQRYLGGALSGAAPCAVSTDHADEHERYDAGEYEKDEVGRLREEADMLQQQLADVVARLDRLGGSN